MATGHGTSCVPGRAYPISAEPPSGAARTSGCGRSGGRPGPPRRRRRRGPGTAGRRWWSRARDPRARSGGARSRPAPWSRTTARPRRRPSSAAAPSRRRGRPRARWTARTSPAPGCCRRRSRRSGRWTGTPPVGRAVVGWGACDGASPPNWSQSRTSPSALRSTSTALVPPRRCCRTPYSTSTLSTSVANSGVRQEVTSSAVVAPRSSSVATGRRTSGRCEAEGDRACPCRAEERPRRAGTEHEGATSAAMLTAGRNRSANFFMCTPRATSGSIAMPPSRSGPPRGPGDPQCDARGREPRAGSSLYLSRAGLPIDQSGRAGRARAERAGTVPARRIAVRLGIRADGW